MTVMRLLRSLMGAIANRLPDPDHPDGGRIPVDPRIDPDTLERFGRDELADFGMARSRVGGVGQVTGGGAGKSTDALTRAIRAREERRKQRP